MFFGQVRLFIYLCKPAMGIKLDKIESISMGDSFAFRTLNPAQVGICYVCVHNQGESSTKHRHHSLFIDVAGRSRYDQCGEIFELNGLMLHVTAKPQTGKTKYRHGSMKILGKKNQIYTVGKIVDPHPLEPARWAFNLCLSGLDVYNNLVKINNGEQIWNSALNCQIFVKKMIEKLELQYPSNLGCCDLSPVIVDFSILCIRCSTSSKNRLNKKESDDDSE